MIMSSFFNVSEPHPTGSFVKNVRDVQGKVQAYRPELHPTDPTVNPGKSGPPGAQIDEVVNIPAGNVGEVVFSTEYETIVLFPIHSTDKLEPHLIKAEGFTSDFKQVVRKPAQNPFIWNRNRRLKDPGKPLTSSWKIFKWQVGEQDESGRLKWRED